MGLPPALRCYIVCCIQYKSVQYQDKADKKSGYFAWGGDISRYNLSAFRKISSCKPESIAGAERD